MVPLSSSDDLPLPLLDRYLAGEATAAESAIVEVWIGNSVGRRGELESLRHAVTEPVAALAPGDVDAAVAGVLTASGLAGRVPRTGRPASESGMKGQSYRLPRLWPQGVGSGAARGATAIAALLVVAFGIGAAVHGVRQRPRRYTVAQREYATAAGQRLSITLVDGTQLTLAPASRVRVAADYARGAAGRELTLEGEAYFAVVHDAAHPFAVRAQGVVARDVGTTFDIRAYPEDAGARIAVADGVVAVVGAACSGLSSVRNPQVHAGDVASVENGTLAVQHGVDVAALTAWTQGRLVFAGAPLREVVRQLSRWYGVDIAINGTSLGDKPVYGTFDQPSVVPVLDILTRAAGGSYVRDSGSGETVRYIVGEDHKP